MHRRSLRCISPRTPQGITSRLYSESSAPLAQQKLPEKRPKRTNELVSTLNSLIHGAAYGAHHAPAINPSKFNKRRAGTAHGNPKSNKRASAALHNYPWKGGLVRRLEDSVTGASAGHMPTIEKQKLTTLTEQDEVFLEGGHISDGVDTLSDITKHGIGSFVELRRYVLSYTRSLVELLNIVVEIIRSHTLLFSEQRFLGRNRSSSR